MVPCKNWCRSEFPTATYILILESYASGNCIGTTDCVDQGSTAMSFHQEKGKVPTGRASWTWLLECIDSDSV